MHRATTSSCAVSAARWPLPAASPPASAPASERDRAEGLLTALLGRVRRDDELRRRAVRGVGAREPLEHRRGHRRRRRLPDRQRGRRGLGPDRQRRQDLADVQRQQRVVPGRVEPAADPPRRHGASRATRSARCPSTGSGCGPASGTRRRGRWPASAGPQGGQAGHPGVEPQLLVELQHLLRCVRELGPGIVVGRIRIRDNGVEPVVAAVHRDEHEDPAVRRQRVGLPAGQYVLERHPGRARPGARSRRPRRTRAAGSDG